MDVTQKKGTSSLRKGRYSQRNQIYHITSTTLDREPFLQGYEQGRFVVNAFRTEEKCGHARTLAFVVMPDHFHWLIEQRDACMLSIVVGNVKSHAARRINRTLGRTGPLWQPGFYDRAIRRDEDIAAVARYIIANPLRLDWLIASAIIRYGMRFGCDRNSNRACRGAPTKPSWLEEIAPVGAGLYRRLRVRRS